MDQVRGAFHGPVDRVQTLPDFFVRTDLSGQNLDIPGNGLQDVVEVVGDAAGQRPDGLHFLGLQQLFFHLAQFAFDPHPFRGVLVQNELIARIEGHRPKMDGFSPNRPCI